MTAPVFKNGEWLLPEDHEAQEKAGRQGLGGSDFRGAKAFFERAGGSHPLPRGMGGDHVDANQAHKRTAMIKEFMHHINDPVNDEVDSINTPKVPDLGGRFSGGGGNNYLGVPGGGNHYFEVGGRRFENPTPSTTIDQLPNDLRQLLIDWAHEQDKHRNDGSINGAAPYDPMGNLQRLPHDAQQKLLHPKKKYFTDSNFYDDRSHEFPQNVHQKQVGKKIAETLLTKQDEKAHQIFKQTVERNFDEQVENLIRNTRWKTGVDGFPEYPTPIKDYLTHRFLAIDATQPVVTNHHQHIFTKNEFEHHHHTERAPHGGVTPEQAYNLIMGLKDSRNRGAGMFEKARQRADEHVVDDTNRAEMARRPLSPSLQRMLSEVNEPTNEPLPPAPPMPPFMMNLGDSDKDRKIDELQQIIRAQQEEIARLRAAVAGSSEIPASPSGVDQQEEAPPTPPPPKPMFDYEWSRKHWPFAGVA